MGGHRELRAVGWAPRAAAPFRSSAEGCEIGFQPIAELRTGRVTAYDSQCRSGERRSSDICPGPPEKAGQHLESELAVIVTSVEAVRGLPDGVALVVKASPLIIASGEFADAIAGLSHERIVVELANGCGPGERDALFDQARLLQFRGVRIAMRGPGNGHSRLRRILRIRPDLIKLGRKLISGIGTDCGKRLIVAGHVSLAREIGAQTVGEGIETRHELATLRAMDVDLGQGSIVGRPVDYSTALAQLSFMRHAE